MITFIILQKNNIFKKVRLDFVEKKKYQLNPPEDNQYSFSGNKNGNIFIFFILKVEIFLK